MNEKKFATGMVVKSPHENAPDYVKCKLHVHIKDFGELLMKEHKAGNEWITIDVKVSQGGKWYAEVDTWKPSSHASGYAADMKPDTKKKQPDFDDDIPF